jgi:hypothetical protein
LEISWLVLISAPILASILFHDIHFGQ